MLVEKMSIDKTERDLKMTIKYARACSLFECEKNEDCQKDDKEGSF